MPGPGLTTAVHSTHSEALQHLNFSESLQNKVPVKWFFFFFLLKEQKKINVMPSVTGTHVLLLSYGGEVLVPWGVSTLRAIVLKAQVSKGRTPVLWALAHCCPQGTSNQGSHPKPRVL